MSEQAAVTSKGIKELLKSHTWPEAIAEFIWNGFDANATAIELSFEYDEAPLDVITGITIKDNGVGIPYQQLQSKFKPIYESEKAAASIDPKNHSLPHGKNGKGRLTFFTFADHAKWDTTCSEANELIDHEIEISAESLDSYNPKGHQVSGRKETGTKVTFRGQISIEKSSIETELIDHLKKEFAWFLELNKDKKYSISIDGLPLDYTDLIAATDQLAINEAIPDKRFEVRFILWKNKLNGEFSKYYFINSKGVEVWKENTTLNNKGDSFYHSVYIQGPYFDDFLWSECGDDGELFRCRKDDVFKDLSARLAKLLHQKRNPFIEQYTEKLMQTYEAEGVLPKYDKSPVAQFQKEALSSTIKELYKVQPKVFTSLNTTQKKAFIGLLNALLELGADDRLLDIISKIVEMTPDERNEFAHILDYANISAITKTIGMIKDRIAVVEQLKNLVFDDTWNANEGHLQEIIERHYWLFGEQYNLVTAEEPKFDEALRRYLYLLRGDGETPSPKIKHVNKGKEMDIFVARRDVRNDVIENIVVELKHPNVKLGGKELNQVDLYQGVVLQQPEFTALNMHWTFILVGKEFDTSGKVARAYESALAHGEKYLTQKNPSLRSKVLVKRWSDIFSEFECRHNFILEKLEIDKLRLIEEMNKAKIASQVVAATRVSLAAETASWQQSRVNIGAN